jgi:DNA-binding NarL/FixJ family response regulator
MSTIQRPRQPPWLLYPSRRLIADLSVAQALRASAEFDVITASQVQDCARNAHDRNVSVALLCVSQRYSTEELRRDIDLLVQTCPLAAVIVVSDSNYEAVMTSLSCGARGFVPIDASIEIMTGAIMMIAAGGTYVPASALMAAQRELTAPSHDCRSVSEMFTTRQLDVMDALRKGKANKTIAYELNMCESTVKVHVRNIMKRLKAKNRTHAVYLAREMLP